MTLTNLEKAENEQGKVKSSIEILEAQHAGHATTPLELSEVDNYCKLANRCAKELEEIYVKILNCFPADKKKYEDEHRDLYTRSLRMVGKFNAIRATFTTSTPPSSHTSSSTVSTPAVQDIKLPRIEIPTFSGNIQEWVAFRDMFVATVEKNTSLSKVQKLAYLKSVVSGEAARLIQTLVLSDTNYDTAWKSLVDRYENDRELLFTVMKHILNQSAVSSPTPTTIRSLIDNTKSSIRQFEVLNGKIDHLFLYIIFMKLDPVTKELWYQTTDAKQLPDLKQFWDFLEQRSMALSAGTSSRSNQRMDKPKAHSHHLQNSGKCSLSCSTSHPIFRCPAFKNMSTQERNEHVKKSKLCYNCLQEGHGSSSCRSTHNCKTCGKKHNTLLHNPIQNKSSNENQQHNNVVQQEPNKVTSHHGHEITDVPSALLATAVIKVAGQHGLSLCRALLDGGSSTSFITETCAKKLGLQIQHTHTEVVGLSSTSVGTAVGVATVSIKPHFPSQQHYVVTALVIQKITSKLPTRSISAVNWPHLHSLQLADPLFHTSASVDFLLGADIFYELLENEKRTGENNQPIAVKSGLGWLVAGQFKQKPIISVNSFITNIELDHQLQRFWESESTPETTALELTPEETKCEEISKKFSRDLTGRFTVPVPWNGKLAQLGSSRENAIRRLLSMERRLSRSEQGRKHREEYVSFMREYQQLGHMTKVPPEELTSPLNQTHYIPHHFVLKADSTTTRFRVVFDGSCPTSSGHSLNDAMLTGPKVQSNLYDIVLRFRLHSVAFTADIAKMYRQIRLGEQDSDLHRILWREDSSQPIEEYRLETVTYGTKSAPYLATRCLKQLALEEQDNFPRATKVAAEDFYVDDLMSGDSDTDSAITTVTELISLCASGGFNLRKWTSNNEDLLSMIPEDLQEKRESVPLEEEATIKTLGIHWRPKQDVYTFSINWKNSNIYTKRSILSQMSKLFDPIGWLAPVTIKAKILMQDIWKEKLDWDIPVSDFIKQQWIEYTTSLPHLESISMKRQYFDSCENVHLIGFSDASEKALAAVVYLCRFHPDGTPEMTLVTAKTRVASTTAVTIPRMELNAAVELARLLTNVKQCLKMEFASVRAYTDSSITLNWIKSDPNRWKPYVKSRVIKIQMRTNQSNWFHVKGELNPADCASRGLTADQLVNHQLWWHGSPSAITSPSTPSNIDLNQELEVKTVKCFVSTDTVLDYIKKNSRWFNLVRVTAWLLRFSFNAKAKKLNCDLRTGTLKTDELFVARQKIIKHVQGVMFGSEISILQKQQQLPVKNKIAPLAPFIDCDGILRVGGRLRNAAAIPNSQRHPALLPRHHHITSLIIDIRNR